MNTSCEGREQKIFLRKYLKTEIIVVPNITKKYIIKSLVWFLMVKPI